MKKLGMIVAALVIVAAGLLAHFPYDRLVS
jgi:hypothetical protein